MDIDVLDTLAETQELISEEEEETAHDIIGSVWRESDVLIVVPALKRICSVSHSPGSILVKQCADEVSWAMNVKI